MAAVGVLVILLVATALAVVAAADDSSSNGTGTTTHLSFFMHDIQSGSAPTAVKVIKGPGAVTATALGMSFGDTTVMDNPVTETSSPTSAALGRMQGFYMLASQSSSSSGDQAALMVCANLLLTSGAHNGSTVAVMGRDDTGLDVRELSVVGGTGDFRMAEGYVLWKTASMAGADATVQLDVFLTTSGNTSAIDANAPASPVDGGSGSGSGSSGSSGGSKASSGGWARVFAVAVVAAVVGSSVW